MKRSLRGRNRERGQALVEFALVVPVFLSVAFGLVEGSYYAVATVAVNHATHEGARYGVLESTVDPAQIKGRVQSAAAPVAFPASTDITLKLNGSTCDDACYTDRAAGDRLMVITAYDHVPLLGYVFPGLAFPADAQAELWVEL